MERREPELVFIVGVTRSGKTPEAIRRAREAALAHGWPLLAIDTARDARLAHLPELPWREALRSVWALDRSCRVVPSRSGDGVADVLRILAAVESAGRVVLLFDDAGFWTDDDGRVGKALRSLCRVYRHRQVHLVLTTQHLSGDVGQVMLAAGPRLVIFKTAATESLKRLRKLGLPAEDVELAAQLPQFQYLELESGFPGDGLDRAAP